MSRLQINKCEFTGTINGGHFEKGRWVNFMTPFMDAMREEPMKEPTFEITVCSDVPIFQQGAVIKWEKKEHKETFTQSQLQKMVGTCNNDAKTSGCACLPVVRQ
jgi:hypothetical protein